MTDGAEALAAAIRDFDVAAVREMLERFPELANAVVNRADNGGETMLCYAITRRAGEDFARVSDEQAAIVQALVDAGADLQAARFPNGDPSEPGATGMFPLGNAAWLGKLRLVELLIAEGADVDAEPEPTDSALSVAADHRHTAVVERLIETGASYTARPLVQAGLVRRLRKLLDEDPGAVNRPVDLGHLSGVTGPPLLALVEEYSYEDPHMPDVARLLLDRGANVTIAGSDGKTAIQRLRGKRRLCEEDGVDTRYCDEVMQMLRDAGAED